MKKTCFIAGICVAMMLALASCGSSIDYSDYDLEKCIEVGEYKNLKAAAYTVSVTEDEIETRIQEELEASATSEELNDKTPIEEGDVANIDYTGTLDGKAFDGGSAEGYDLEIGSGTFIDGFEDGLIGKKVGEKVKLNLTFPEDYASKELAGKDVVFDVTINSAVREGIPEYNLDFVQNTTDYMSLQEYESALEKQIYNEKEDEAIMNQQSELWTQVVDATVVNEYPEKLVEYYCDANNKYVDYMADMYGMTREEALTSNGFGNEEEFAAVNEDSSKLRIKDEMIVEYIAQKEGISYTEEEKTAYTEDLAAMGYDDELIEIETGRNLEGYVHSELLRMEVLDFILENAKIEGAPKK